MRLQWGGFEYEDKLGGVKTTTFSTMNRNLVMSKYYVEMGFLVETTHVFGFGERQKSFELAPGEYTSWTDGRENRVEKGKRGGNSYGDHPFVLCKLKDNTFSGIFFKNSNAKVLNYTHVDENRSILDFKAVGGTLDFFFFIGETADDVIKSYLNVIGRPYFPPFWSLGFHQSARRYNQTSVINDVMNAYKLSDMPLESIWLDIEFMDRYRNFEINKTRFPNFASTASAIHKNGQKIIPIVDAGLAADLSYNTYKEAYENNHLIIDPLTGQPLFGEVWPGKAGFIDFLHPGSNYFWIKWLECRFTFLI